VLAALFGKVIPLLYGKSGAGVPSFFVHRERRGFIGGAPSGNGRGEQGVRAHVLTEFTVRSDATWTSVSGQTGFEETGPLLSPSVYHRDRGQSNIPGGSRATRNLGEQVAQTLWF
jgi:hypothetical protein